MDSLLSTVAPERPPRSLERLWVTDDVMIEVNARVYFNRFEVAWTPIWEVASSKITLESAWSTMVTYGKRFHDRPFTAEIKKELRAAMTDDVASKLDDWSAYFSARDSEGKNAKLFVAWTILCRSPVHELTRMDRNDQLGLVRRNLEDLGGVLSEIG